MNKLMKKILLSVAIFLLLGAGGLYARHKIAETNSIGKEYAAKFAADEAGFKIEEVIVKTVDFKNDDGRYIYHVELEKNNKTYEYELLASNGNIVSRGQDAKVDVASLDKEDGKQEVSKKTKTESKQTDVVNKEINAEKKEKTNKNKITSNNKKASTTEKKVDKKKSKKPDDKIANNSEKKPVEKTSKKTVENSKPKASKADTTNTQESRTKTTEKSSSKQSDSTTTKKTSTVYIGSEAAKNISLKHAGISKDRAIFSKAKLEEDDGVMYYEVEFSSGNNEYEYDIAAKTGKIIDYEWDNDD